jgi:hypothetical protein
VWDTVIRNAKTFIAAGGRAHWDMLIFKHNEHQVEEAKKLAKDMGFVVFRAKVSRRFESKPINFLEPPVGFVNESISTSVIDCHALKENSLYMDSQGNLLPCCFLADIDNEFSYKDFPTIINSWSSVPVKKCQKSCSVNNNTTNFTKQWREEVYFQ